MAEHTGLTFQDIGTYWRHSNGNSYVIVMLANTDGDDPAKREKYPPTVVYRGENGKIWARRIDDWHRSMTRDPSDNISLLGEY